MRAAALMDLSEDIERMQKGLGAMQLVLGEVRHHHHFCERGL